MHLIVFTSTCAAPEATTEDVVEEFSDTVRRMAEAADLTGILICDQGRFLEAVEGDEAALRRHIKSVMDDPRHHGVEIIVDQEIAARSFTAWHVDTFYLHDADIAEPETIAHLRDIFDRHFTMDGATFIRYLREMCDALDTFKILQASSA